MAGPGAGWKLDEAGGDQNGSGDDDKCEDFLSSYSLRWYTGSTRRTLAINILPRKRMAERKGS